MLVELVAIALQSDRSGTVQKVINRLLDMGGVPSRTMKTAAAAELLHCRGRGAMTLREELEELVRLPRSTGECDQGPQVFMQPHRMELRYDNEDDQGHVTWTTVRFDGAFAVRVTPDPAVSLLQAKAYSRLCAVRNSAWIAELSSNWREGTIGDDARHFAVYFDNYGAVEVLAPKFEVVAAGEAAATIPGRRE